MRACYLDILERVKMKPKWWDENGVPRYCVFSPGDQANLYATEVALVQIQCAGCAREFTVAVSSQFAPLNPNRLSVGAPPNVGCCEHGPAMCAAPIFIAQFWRRVHLKWQRIPNNEIDFGN